MQKLFLRFAGLALLSSTIFFTSCGDDIIDPTNPLAPDLRFVIEAGLLSGDAELFPNEAFSVKISALKGDNPLQSVRVEKNGTALATSLFTIDGGAITSNNPFLITGADQNGATYTITITNDGTVGQSNTYKFIVSDDKQNTDDVSLTITTVQVPVTSTPLNVSFTAVVVNNADGPNQGGLDLDAGTTVPAASTISELRDKGINLALPAAQNWIQRIEPRNGADLRLPNLMQLENFTFASADSREILSAAWDTGTNLTESPVLATGTLFMIKKGDAFYLIRTTAVNVTTNNNLDTYTFDVKGHKQ